MREAHGLTLEEAGSQLRQVTRDVGVMTPDATSQALRQHEHGEVYPDPSYRRAYCLLYRATEHELGFHDALPNTASPVRLSEPVDAHKGVRSLALDDVLDLLAQGDPDSGGQAVCEQIVDAWSRSHATGDSRHSTLLMVCGYAGSGKSEFCRFVSQVTGWPVLDKDLVTQPLVERLLVALGSDPNDRHSALYREQVRPLEYQCLLDTAYINVEARASAILSAPFISEASDELWLQSLSERCQARGVDLSVVWVQSDLESMHEYVRFRSAARDMWKLQHWDEYAAGIDLQLRPAIPHLLVDNRRGAAVARTDQVRRLLK
ncbi:AAA family ATPase [Streptomyces sp. NPDC002917]|uniref:AAA family ATPase n=1 Tax=Streptomyces sp. NPDC002917 TaxID=3364671 RepID=UPI0036BE9F2A